MKKLSSALFVCILILGCTPKSEEEIDLEIYDFEYNGHQYLIFSEYGQTINVLHDPDCECNHSTGARINRL